jgi:MFS family permease
MADAASISSVKDRRWLILGVIGLAQLMVILDLTVMNIALPSAQRALHFTTADRQWVVTAYTLAFGSLLLGTSLLNTIFAGAVASYLTAHLATALLVGYQALMRLALLHGYDTGFWWIAGIFASGAVAGGVLLRRGPLAQKRAPSSSPGGTATAPTEASQEGAR